MLMTREKAGRIIRAFMEVVNCVDPKWRFPYGPVPEAYVVEGLERLEAFFKMGISDRRYVDYIVYQVFRFADAIAEKNSRFQYTWCFSENAFGKYRAQYFGSGKRGIDYYIDLWLKENGISREHLLGRIQGPGENKWRKFIEMPSDEMVKMRFHNTESGFILCSSSTMGWSPGSNACSGCNYVEKCMTVTDRRYPELLRLRKQTRNQNG